MLRFIAVILVVLTVAELVHCYSLGGHQRVNQATFDDYEANPTANWNDWNAEQQAANMMISTNQNQHSTKTQRESNWNSNWNTWHTHTASLPEAAPYRLKITERLSSSMALENQPQIKQKIIEFAETKLNSCKGALENTLDKHCVGRFTGQMMQLIAAFENVNRDVTSHWRSEPNY